MSIRLAQLCEGAAMVIDVLFAGMPVARFDVAVSWYARLFGRDPDIVAHEQEVMWRVTNGGWLYVIQAPDRAGRSLASISVADLEQAVNELAVRGVTTGPIEPVGSAGRKATTVDPDGNSVALIQVS